MTMSTARAHNAFMNQGVVRVGIVGSGSDVSESGLLLSLDCVNLIRDLPACLPGCNAYAEPKRELRSVRSSGGDALSAPAAAFALGTGDTLRRVTAQRGSLLRPAERDGNAGRAATDSRQQ